MRNLYTEFCVLYFSTLEVHLLRANPIGDVLIAKVLLILFIINWYINFEDLLPNVVTEYR